MLNLTEIDRTGKLESECKRIRIWFGAVFGDMFIFVFGPGAQTGIRILLNTRFDRLNILNIPVDKYDMNVIRM